MPNGARTRLVYPDPGTLSAADLADLVEIFGDGLRTGEIGTPQVDKLVRLDRKGDGTHRVWLGNAGYHLRIAPPGKERALLHDHAIRKLLPDDVPRQKTVLGTTSRGEVIIFQRDIQGPLMSEVVRHAETPEEVGVAVDQAVDVLKRIHAVKPTDDEWRDPPLNWVTTLNNAYNRFLFVKDLELLRDHKLIHPRLVGALPVRVAYLKGVSGLENLGFGVPDVRPISRRKRATHGDYHADNLIMPEVQGEDHPGVFVIDFEKAMEGLGLYDGYQLMRSIMRNTDLFTAYCAPESVRYLMDPPAASALAIEALDIQRQVRTAAEFCRLNPEGYTKEAIRQRYTDLALDENLQDILVNGSEYRNIASDLLTIAGDPIPDVLLQGPDPAEEMQFYEASVAPAGAAPKAWLSLGRALRS